MAKATLPTNYQDDVLKSTMGGKRRYTMTDNSDGTKTLEDATQYEKVGSNFGAADINKTNTAVNAAADASKIIDNVNDIKANTQAGYMMGALAGKQLISDLGGLSFYEDSSGKYVVGADSVPKKLGSVPIKGHLKAGRTRGGAGVGEITFYDIPKGTSIKISNLSLPYGPNNTINFYVKVNGNSILTTNGSYNITSDINTIIIYMYVYLSEEGSGGYGNCDYEIAF